MSLSNFNLRGIPPEIMSALKREAKKKKTSVNLLIMQFIKNNLGYSHPIKQTVYHDLDKLAGTWSAKDLQEFQKNIADFEKIDKDLWV